MSEQTKRWCVKWDDGIAIPKFYHFDYEEDANRFYREIKSIDNKQMNKYKMTNIQAWVNGCYPSSWSICSYY